jgi:putative tryptophan/tyrosine transport system substrate-binding protein
MKDARTSYACLAAAALFALSCLSASFVHAATEIAVLNSSDMEAYHSAIAGFKATGPSGALYTQYDLQGNAEDGRKLARKIRASDASLVLAVGLKAALAAKLEIPDTPIVYMMILDPLKHHLTAPNMTGTMLEVPIDRQLKTIRAFLPSIQRIGALYDPQKGAARFKDAERQSQTMAMGLKGFPVDSEKELPQQLRTLLWSSDALWLLPDSTVLTSESLHFILDSAQAQHIPVIGFSPELTRLGALLSLSVDYAEVGRETGLLARRTLNGEQMSSGKPVPIERFMITVNMKTARFLGLSFPKEVHGLIDESY